MIRNDNDYKKDLENIIQYIPEKKFNILVTGATGLIGSCLVDALIYANNYYGREYTIYAMGRSAEKLKSRFPSNTQGFHFLVQDIQSAINNTINLDYIVNAASNADPRTYALYPAETILTNVVGTKNILDYAKNHKGTKVLFTSTMEVYGDVQNKDVNTEDDFGLIDFNQIRSGYPESKRTAELLCRSYTAEYNVQAVIARLGYIYGPTMSNTDNKVVAQFIRNIINNEDIVLRSKGLQRRSYCYVSDTVAGILAVLFKGTPGKAYNIAAECSVTTIHEMAKTAAEIGGCKVIYDLPNEIEVKGSSKPQDAVLDTKRLEALGWCPRFDLKTGLEHTVAILKTKSY